MKEYEKRTDIAISDIEKDIGKYIEIDLNGIDNKKIVDAKSNTNKKEYIEIVITDETRDRGIMGIKHDEYPVYGLQFYTESIYTPMDVHMKTL